MAQPDDDLAPRDRAPSPVTAAIGLAAESLDEWRRLPRRVVTFPMRSVGTAVRMGMRLQRRYEALSDRGHDVLARLPGRGPGLRDSAREAALRVDDAAQQVAEMADLVDRVGRVSGATPGGPVPQVQPAGPQRHDTAVSPEVERAVEEAADEVRAPGPAVQRDDLPLPDFDHLTLGGLRARLRRLEVADLVVLRDYEKAHGDRLPVVTMLDNRIAKLAADGPGANGRAVAPAGLS